MRQHLTSRWFALADLALVLLIGAVWYLLPQTGGWLLLVALLPWMARGIAGRFPFHRTRFDAFLLIFVLCAAMGVWATYDRPEGWAKFWCLVGAVLLYYALSSQPYENLWLSAGFFSAISALIGTVFLLTADWISQPADFNLITRLGVWWMGVRPPSTLVPLHPNFVGGIIAIFMPLTIALGWMSWHQKNWKIGGYIILTGGVAAWALIFSSSRLAMFALITALGLWTLWILSGFIARHFSWRQASLFGSATLLMVLIGLILLNSLPGGLISLASQIPGPDSTTSRLEIARHTVKLIADFPFTGGGLASFPGLFAHYMMVLPFFLFGYSHNLYLDVALEQGILALVIFLLILSGSFWLILREGSLNPLQWAILAGLIVLVVHGLADDPLYGERGTPLLFSLPALAIAATRTGFPSGGQTGSTQSGKRLNKRLGLVWLGIILVIGLLYSTLRGPLQAKWYANLGAVEMARIELSGFPTGKWDEGQNTERLAGLAAHFQHSLSSYAQNFTAHHRLGLIAMQTQDFRNASIHFEAAYAIDANHRGLIKVMGYNYVWSGQFEKATPLLNQIPEAKRELEVYTWWWGTQGREDLSNAAKQMAINLDLAD